MAVLDPKPAKATLNEYKVQDIQRVARDLGLTFGGTTSKANTIAMLKGEGLVSKGM